MTKIFLSCFCGVDSGNATGSFSSFAAFISFNGSGAVHCAPDSAKSHCKGNSAINEKFRIGDVSEIACTGNSENGDDSCCCHNFEDEVKNICSFHFTTSFPSLSMGCVRKNRTSVLVLWLYYITQNLKINRFWQKIEQLFLLVHFCRISRNLIIK